MSAFMVSTAHLSALAAAAFYSDRFYGQSFAFYHDGARFEYAPGSEDQIVALLYRENRRSILARYPGDEAYAGPAEPPRFERPRKTLTAVEILKACDCYAYQACESNDWESTAAHAFLQTLRSKMIHQLPGYDAAAWEITS